MIKEKAFKFFLKSIAENNMMVINSPTMCPPNWIEYWGDVEKETVRNLYTLSDEFARVTYLNSLIDSLRDELRYYKMDSEGKLEKLYSDFEITEKDIIQMRFPQNALSIALSNSERDLKQSGRWTDKYLYPRYCYFNFHLFQILSNAIAFLEARKHEVLFGFNQGNNVPANLIHQQRKGKKSTMSTFKYAHFDGRGDAIKEFLEFLISKNFVKKGTSIKVFKPIFSGVELDKCKQKVKWMGNNNALAYLIRTLVKEKLISGKGKQHWNIVVKVFEGGDGKGFEREQLKNCHTLAPEVKELLDKAIALLKVKPTR